MSFDLQVISRMPQFNGKKFKPYHIEGQDCIGVWGDEEFELCFRNNTGNKVQVRLSLDGTDVATGKKAHTNTNNEGMWVVKPYENVKLQAWVETNKKGRQFIFASHGTGVAAHMHGDLSNKGIIAAAVFTEGYVAPPVPVFYDRFLGGIGGSNYSASGVLRRNVTKGAVEICDFNESVSGPEVGAGREVIQKIGTAQGLIQPTLNRIITLKYMWYDDLVKKLESRGLVHEGTMPNGFPGDQEKRFMDLSQVPMAGTSTQAKISNVIYRFD